MSDSDSDIEILRVQRAAPLRPATRLTERRTRTWLQRIGRVLVEIQFDLCLPRSLHSASNIPLSEILGMSGENAGWCGANFIQDFVLATGRVVFVYCQLTATIRKYARDDRGSIALTTCNTRDIRDNILLTFNGNNHYMATKVI
jgi:hypothetical protein